MIPFFPKAFPPERCASQLQCGSRGKPSIMTSQRDNLQEDMRFRVLRLLEDNPELSQRQMANQLGVSTGRAHYILGALIDKGLVKLGNFSAAPDKRRYAYILTAKGMSEKAALTGRFLKRKLAEYEALKTEIATLEAELDTATGPETPPDHHRTP